MIRYRLFPLIASVFLVGILALMPLLARAQTGSSIGSFNSINTAASTVPKNGDVNLYGLVVVPASTGDLVAGDLLVSNFNNHRNLQGTGSKDGTSVTAQAGCLLLINKMGQVVKTISGGPINGPWDMAALDSGSGVTLFVTNVLNGTVAASPKTVDDGAVVRLQLTNLSASTPTVGAEKVIGTGFPERTDPAALVVGPTGVGLASGGTL